VSDYDNQLQQIMLSIPNLPHDSVIVGQNEKDNKEIRKFGKPKKFKFKSLSH
jgi:seryl-tRNA synthetase